MSFKALAKATGGGIRTLAVATVDNTKAALNPPKGDRKLRLCLLLTLPFLLILVISAFYYKENIIEIFKIMKETITYVLGIFTTGNIGERIAAGFGGKENGPDDTKHSGPPFVP